MQAWYDFVTEVGDSFLEAYVPVVLRRKDMEYTQEQRDWQALRDDPSWNSRRTTCQYSEWYQCVVQPFSVSGVFHARAA